MKKSPYKVIKSRYISEKASHLASLKDIETNKCIVRCQSPKAVFIVDPEANKLEIKEAIQEIYAEDNIKVTNVNTIVSKPKRKGKNNRRGRKGFKSSFKKAVVTFQAGDEIKD